jgi:hypothetical protein
MNLEAIFVGSFVESDVSLVFSEGIHNVRGIWCGQFKGPEIF